MKTQYDIVVGIDPDIDKNGVATLRTGTRSLFIDTLTFANTLNYLLSLQRTAETQGKSLMVVVEAGWLNASNWHVNPRMSRQECAAIGASVGANQQTGKLLVQMLEHWRIRHIEQKPLPLTYRVGHKRAQIWHGKDGKITHDDLAAFTGYTQRNNQEGRDAALLAWTFAGFPVKYANIC